jgi:hypothetical protein
MQMLLRENYIDCQRQRERERGPYGPYIHSTEDKRTNERTNDMTKAEGFLTNQKKHLELQETSRTPTIVLSFLRVMLPTCSPQDVLKILEPVTAAANVSKVVDTVIKAAASPGLYWGFIVPGLIVIVAITAGTTKMDTTHSHAQSDRLLEYQMAASRFNLMNAWM